MHEAAVRILLADDHAILREGLKRVIESNPSYTVVGEATTGREAVRLAASLRPDLMLLDVSMPELTGLEALDRLAPGTDGVKVIVFTASIRRTEMARALQQGARGVVLKTSGSDVLFAAIAAVLRGEYWLDRGSVSDLVRLASSPVRGRHLFGLTDRQLEIVSAVVDGMTNREIGAKLAISDETVKHHLTQIFNKTGVSTRLELALLATSRGLVASNR
jgi:two-component system nitrate/nitrite response regulator NarL